MIEKEGSMVVITEFKRRSGESLGYTNQSFQIIMNQKVMIRDETFLVTASEVDVGRSKNTVTVDPWVDEKPLMVELVRP